MQAMMALSDENCLTPTLRIGLKRHLFDFCFFFKKKIYVFCLSLFLVLYKKKL
jgi:hypothetical protein